MLLCCCCLLKQTWVFHALWYSTAVQLNATVSSRSKLVVRHVLDCFICDYLMCVGGALLKEETVEQRLHVWVSKDGCKLHKCLSYR